MIKHTTLRHAALALAAVFALQAYAQTSGGTPGTPSRATTSGEANPNDSNGNRNGSTPAIVQRAEKSRPAQATKRVAKRSKKAVKRTGSRAAKAIRNTGERIGDKLPPAPSTAPQR